LDARKRRLFRNGNRFLVEMIGTLIITFAASLAAILPSVEKETNFQISSLSVALVTTALTFSLAYVSGAHFNPIITLAFALRKEFKVWRVFLYWIAQFIGAIIAGGFIYLHFENIKWNGAPVSTIDVKKAYGIETLFSMILVLVVLNVSERKGKISGTNAALAVGSVLASLSLLGSTLTGASMNPARALGPPIYAHQYSWDHFWIYLVAPLTGCFIATVITYMLAPFRRKKTELKASGFGISKDTIIGSE